MTGGSDESVFAEDSIPDAANVPCLGDLGPEQHRLLPPLLTIFYSDAEKSAHIKSIAMTSRKEDVLSKMFRKPDSSSSVYDTNPSTNKSRLQAKAPERGRGRDRSRSKSKSKSRHEDCDSTGSESYSSESSHSDECPPSPRHGRSCVRIDDGPVIGAILFVVVVIVLLFVIFSWPGVSGWFDSRMGAGYGSLAGRAVAFFIILLIIIVFLGWLVWGAKDGGKK